MLVLLHHLTTAGLVAVSAAVCPAWRTGSVLFLGPAQDAQATFQSKTPKPKKQQRFVLDFCDGRKERAEGIKKTEKHTVSMAVRYVHMAFAARVYSW